ncbi:MAG: MFS transporter [Streptosporangiales bacterium]|nr:MFS transporter [Streptosporangiales bacterium]
MVRRPAEAGVAGSPGVAGPRLGAVLPGLMLAMFLGALDQTIMAPALPAVAADLGGIEQMPAVVTGYLVAATVVMPLYGKLGDLFGRKPVMQVAIGIFVLGAVGCAFATSMPTLVAARVVQGVGGGGLMIGAQAIIGEIVSPRERGRVLGIIGGAYVVAAVAGPLVGGFFVDQLTWRWIFWLYPGIGVLALLTVTATLHLPRPSHRPRVDYGGAAALALAVVGLVLLTDAAGRSDRPGWLFAVLAVATAAGIVGWLVSARVAAEPIVPLHLFRDRAFAIPVAVSFLLGFALFGAVSYVPAFLQIALGTSATTAGLLVTALMAGVLVTMTGSGRLITRYGKYKPFPVVGTAVATAGLGMLALLHAGSSRWYAAVAMLVLGLGVGLVMQVMVLAVQNTVAYQYLGAATSTVTFLRQIGSSVGVAAVGALITSRFADRVPAATMRRLGDGGLSPKAIDRLPTGLREVVSDAFGAAVPPVFGYVAPLMAVAFLLTLLLPARPLRTTAHVDSKEAKEAERHD